MAGRFRELSEFDERGAEIVVRLEIVRIQSERMAQWFDCFPGSSCLEQRGAEIAEGAVIVGPVANRCFEMNQGAGDLAGFDQGIAQVVVGVGMAGIGSQGLLKMGDRFVKTSFPGQELPQVIMGAVKVGSQRQRGFKVGEGFVFPR